VNETEVWTLPKGFGTTARFLFDEITGMQYGDKADRFQWLVNV